MHHWPTKQHQDNATLDEICEFIRNNVMASYDKDEINDDDLDKVEMVVTHILQVMYGKLSRGISR